MTHRPRSDLERSLGSLIPGPPRVDVGAFVQKQPHNFHLASPDGSVKSVAIRRSLAVHIGAVGEEQLNQVHGAAIGGVL